MGHAPSQPTPQHRGPPTAPIAPRYRSTLASYFVAVQPTLLTHDHTEPTIRDTADIASALSTRLPLPLVQRTLEFAGIWNACTVLNRARLDVNALGSPPHGHRGDDWSTGQEQEWDIANAIELGANGGLHDTNGNVWYLVSGRIGHSIDEGNDDRTAGNLDGNSEEGGDNDSSNDIYEDARDGSSASSDDLGIEQQPRKTIWVRSITIDTLSCDQGWSSSPIRHHGTYQQSYSWFEASLLRDGREVAGSRCSIQNNVHAGQYFRDHRNVLDDSHPLVQTAREGDRVVLWVRAQYPGWVNRVQLTVTAVAHPSSPLHLHLQLYRQAAITVHTTPFPPG